MNKAKLKTIGIWTLQILLGLNFIGASIGKVTSNPATVENFANWGFFDGFYLIIGVLELLGGLLLFIPRTAGYASLLLIIVMIGAAGTHFVHSEWSSIFIPIAHLLVLSVVFYGRFPEELSKVKKTV